MSEHEAIERETVRLLVEALKREHYHNLPDSHRLSECTVCKLIGKFEK